MYISIVSPDRIWLHPAIGQTPCICHEASFLIRRSNNFAGTPGTPWPPNAQCVACHGRREVPCDGAERRGPIDGGAQEPAAPHAPAGPMRSGTARVRAWIFGLCQRAVRRGARRGNEANGLQCGAGSASGESGTSSPGVPIEPGTPGDCETSTKPIVLVSRVTTGAPRSVELRLRKWNDGRFPLPFTVTIPVSFERLRRWCAGARASTASGERNAHRHGRAGKLCCK